MTTSSMALSWTIRSHFFDRMLLSSHGRWYHPRWLFKLGLVQRGVQSVPVCRSILTCWMVEPWNFFRDGVPTKYEAQKKSKLYPSWSQQVSVGKLMHASDAARRVIVLLHGSRRLLGFSLVGWSFRKIAWSCPFQKTCIYRRKMERKTGWKLESNLAPAKYLQNPRKFCELEPWHHEGFVVIRDNFPVLHVTMANLLVKYRDA